MHESSADIGHGIHYNIFAQTVLFLSSFFFSRIPLTLSGLFGRVCASCYSQYYAKIQASFDTRCQSDCTKVVQAIFCYRFVFVVCLFSLPVYSMLDDWLRQLDTETILETDSQHQTKRLCGNSHFRFGDIYELSLQQHVIDGSMQLTI